MFSNNPTAVTSEEVCLSCSRYLYCFELQYFYCEFSLIIGKYENMNKIDIQICAFIFMKVEPWITGGQNMFLYPNTQSSVGVNSIDPH
jgi:hypothetical protein